MGTAIKGAAIAIAALIFTVGASAPGGAARSPEPDFLLAIYDLGGSGGGAARWRIVVGSTTGSVPRMLRAGLDPVWSPDGTRIAFAAVAPGRRSADIFVMRADGSRQERLTATRAADRRPVWSPNGRTLAFVSGDRLALVAAQGGPVRLVPNATRISGVPAWSPAGDRIAVTTAAEGDRDIVVGRTDGSERVVLPDPAGSEGARWDEEDPAWSPDGRRLAFTRRHVSDQRGTSLGSIWVSSAAGADGRRLVEGACCPTWETNGRRLAFGLETYSCIRDYCVPAANTIGVAESDGSKPRVLVDSDIRRASGPTWSRDGRHLVFVDWGPPLEDADIANAYLVNADGTCETALTKARLDWSVAAVRLRPGLPPNRGRRIRCTDLAFVGGGATGSPPRSYGSVASGSRFSWKGSIENRGNEPSTASILEIAETHSDIVSAQTSSGKCSVGRRFVRCVIPSLRPDSVVRVSYVGLAPRNRAEKAAPWNGRPNVQAKVEVTLRGSSRESTLRNNVGRAGYLLSACSYLGTQFAETITGTAARDVICAWRGDDVIRTFGGDDRVQAGEGRDTIDPGTGSDIVLADHDDDTIDTRDGVVDRIYCGYGDDRVTADTADVVAADCEQVERS